MSHISALFLRAGDLYRSIMPTVARQKVFLYFAACVANMMSFSVGIAFSWTSPAIPRLNGLKEPENNPLGKPITSQEQSLLASLYFIGSTVGPFIAGLVAAKLGRKKAIIIFTIPSVVCFLMKAFATSIGVLYGARFIGGLTGGTIFTLIPLYVSEIAENQNRGRLGALFGVFSTTGNLYGYAVGSYASIKVFSLSALIGPAILFLIFPWFIPESPYYWITRGNDEQALKVLKRFRANSDEEIVNELNDIKHRIEEAKRNTGTLKDILKMKSLRKSLLITVVGTSIQQFSGIFAVQLYLQSIFSEAGSDLAPEIASIVIGCVKVGAFAVTVYAVDRFGRRFLLLESAVGVFVSLAGLGTYFFLKSQGNNVDNVSWLPILCLILFVITYNSGMGIIPVVHIGEFFPQQLKSAASIVVVTISSLLSFLITFIFPYLVEGVGIGPSFWIFSCSGIVGGLFTYFIVPETKGKSFDEIQLIFDKNAVVTTPVTSKEDKF